MIVFNIPTLVMLALAFYFVYLTYQQGERVQEFREAMKKAQKLGIEPVETRLNLTIYYIRAITFATIAVIITLMAVGG